MKRVLLAYGTRAGSTREIAEFIGGILSEQGFQVEIRSVNENIDPSAFDAVILGTPVRKFVVLPDAVHFLKRHAKALQPLPAAIFLVGLSFKKGANTDRKMVNKWMASLSVHKAPILEGYFGGKLDYAKIGPLFRWIFSKDKSGELAEGDFRDWDAIRAWTDKLAALWA